MRSGTHLLSELIAKYSGAKRIMKLDKLDLDHINFIFGSNIPNIYVTHWDRVELLSYTEVERFNYIIKNRGIYVIFLDRKDFKEQLLSRILLNYEKDHSPFKNGKFLIKKEDLDKNFRFLKRIREYNNPDNIPVSINQKLYYEDILDGFHINGENIPIVNTKASKNKSKEETISNLKSVNKWIQEFEMKYDSNWVPLMLWRKNYE